MFPNATDPFLGCPALSPAVALPVDMRVVDIATQSIRRKRGATVQKRLPVSEHPVAKEWHPKKNGSARPKDFSQGSELSPFWLCSKGHVWKAPISRRCDKNSPRGCPQCKEAAQLKLRDHLVSCEFAQDLNIKGLGELTQGSKYRATWRCCLDVTHIWKATVESRCRKKNARGCPNCAVRNRVVRGFLSAHPIAREFHPTKNGLTVPADYAQGSTRYVWWQCEKDKSHEWRCKVSARCAVKNPTSCPTCVRKGRKS